MIYVYPNPTNSRVTIDISNFNYNKEWSFRILNVSGQQVIGAIHLNGNQFELDLNQFNSGIYFLEIQIGNKLIITKLIKNS